ncbi:M20 family metallopeptidase [Aeromonas veronii]|uniref:M20 metallopeptidase family protein n=1 Tax=Aeromonas veronii TaxID=654 RepID=UPI00191DDB46|nr:M20 family metallopeptidase [Aeromonas veronii]MBL0624447.1 amidohydrolase [Aeromonas veronii]
MNNIHIEPALLALRNFSQEVRHHLHTIPEASGVEFKTSAYCRELMTGFGYRLTDYPGFTGFHGDLVVDPVLPTIAFRADMDGLEMHDMSEVAFKSTHEGMAHNCGHDSHMAIALTAAKFLAANRERLQYNVRFIFQMAEEDMRVPGAEKMVELGCMKGVDEVYALHNDGAMETGTIKFNHGVMSSWGSAWTLDVHGISAHGSTPHKGLDAIREAVRIIEDMDYIVAKRTSPFSPAVFGCGMINGGTIPNAIADHVQARGTIRAMDAETDQILKNSFKEIVAQSELRGFKTKMVYAGYPAVENHADACARLLQAAADVLPSEGINTQGQPMTGSEDFSYMVNACRGRKGAMFFLGSGCQAKGICNYLHANPYYLDDDCLLVGAQIFINLATRSA